MADSKLDEETRQKILKNPDLVLLDQEIFMSLIDENRFSENANIVDIRNVFLKRLGSKLKKLKDANSKILKNAYENQLSVSKIHGCCLSIIKSKSTVEIFKKISTEFPSYLKIKSVKIILDDNTEIASSSEDIMHKKKEAIHELSEFVGLTKSRLVILRDDLDYSQRRDLGLNSKIENIESEAILRLNIDQKLEGLIFFESTNRKTFSIDQATDYLEFMCKIISKEIENLI